MHNIRFIALSDNLDTANFESSESAEMNMMPIMNAFNKWHSVNTFKKIKFVVELMAKLSKYKRSRYS